jgi:hypothetical protein
MLLPMGNANTDHKFKPYLVYLSKEPGALKNIEILPIQFITDQIPRLGSK